VTNEPNRGLAPDEKQSLAVSTRIAERILADRLAREESLKPRARRWRVGGQEADFREIGEALQVARDGDTIWVSPGHYQAPLRIHASVEVIGDGPPGSVVVEWMNADEPALLIDADRGLITNLSVAWLGQSQAGGQPAVRVAGGRIEVDGIDVVAGHDCALEVSTKRAAPTVRRSSFEGWTAVRFEAAAGGLMEDVELQGEVGLMVSGSQTDPIIRQSTIRGRPVVEVDAGARLRLEGCTMEMSSDASVDSAAIWITGGNGDVISRADIADSTISTTERQVGILVGAGGELSIENSQVVGRSTEYRTLYGCGIRSSFGVAVITGCGIRGYPVGVEAQRGRLDLRESIIEHCWIGVDLKTARAAVIGNRLHADTPVALRGGAVFFDIHGLVGGELEIGDQRFSGNDVGGNSAWLRVDGVDVERAIQASESGSPEYIGSFNGSELCEAMRLGDELEVMRASIDDSAELRDTQRQYAECTRGSAGLDADPAALEAIVAGGGPQAAAAGAALARCADIWSFGYRRAAEVAAQNFATAHASELAAIEAQYAGVMDTIREDAAFRAYLSERIATDTVVEELP